jgi:hypothetical protein
MKPYEYEHIIFDVRWSNIQKKKENIIQKSAQLYIASNEEIFSTATSSIIDKKNKLSSCNSY